MQLGCGNDYPTCGAGGTYEAATFYLAAWKGPVNETDFDSKVQPQDTGPGAAPVQKHVPGVYFLPDRQGPLDNCWIKMAVTNSGKTAPSAARSIAPTYTSTTLTTTRRPKPRTP